MELMQASRQWATRPADERFLSLTEMQQHFDKQRDNSTGAVVSSRKIEAVPAADNKGLTVYVPSSEGGEYAPTNWAFGQLAQLAEAPAGYLRSLPSPIAADCINYGLKFKRDAEDVGVLYYQNGSPILRAATGPNYGRIWNGDIVRGLIERFGDGTSGTFRVPGIFGKDLTEVTKENTTLYAGDRDMFVFLADEANRITIPNRRDGRSGEMARGFFVWNSEVGSKTFGIATFLFDYVCSNRIVWGATEFSEFTIRHTASAPDKFIEQAAPALIRYSQSSTDGIVKAVEAARKARVDDVDEFLQKRFGKRMVETLKRAHEDDEGRPIETLFDVTNAVTAYARDVKYQDTRVELERKGGEILKMAA